ncbi:MAG: hypothetical protein ACFB15_21025 [Cyclobacteriaceae bacterium]
MSASLIEALMIGGIGIIFGGILLSIRHKLHEGLYSKKIFNLSIGIILMCIVGGLISYSTSIKYEKNTIVRTKVAGSMEAKVGEPVPVRTLEFTVNHTGVAHTLSVKPVDPPLKSSFDAEILVTVIDPAKNEVLSARQYFKPEYNNKKAAVKRWQFVDTTFIPQRFGKYTVQIAPITIGIPEVEIWILDPLKEDGQRTFSWR